MAAEHERHVRGGVRRRALAPPRSGLAASSSARAGSARPPDVPTERESRRVAKRFPEKQRFRANRAISPTSVPRSGRAARSPVPSPMASTTLGSRRRRGDSTARRRGRRAGASVRRRAGPGPRLAERRGRGGGADETRGAARGEGGVAGARGGRGRGETRRRGRDGCDARAHGA